MAGCSVHITSIYWWCYSFNCDYVWLQIILDRGTITNWTWQLKQIVEELLHPFGSLVYSACTLEFLLPLEFPSESLQGTVTMPPTPSPFCLTPVVHAILVTVADFTVAFAGVAVRQERTVNTGALLHLFWGQAKKKKTCIHTQTKIEIKAPTRTYYYCITGGHEWLTWPSDGIHLHFFLSVCPQHIWETCKHLLSTNGMHPICTALLRDPKVKHRISEIHSQMHWLPFALKSSAEISQSWRCARPSLMA